MDEDSLRSLLDAVRSGDMHADDAVVQIQAMPFTDMGFARVDHHRQLRQGRSEAVYAPGKAAGQVAAIVGELLSGSATGPVLLSRADPEQVAAATTAHPSGSVHGDPASRSGATVIWRDSPLDSTAPTVAVVTAGTADLPVADECATVLRAHGIAAARITDVGVAGIHRLLEAVPALQNADVVVVVAGMEGALASVVGGLTGAPVIAVPTSVGYGSALEGVTALLSMTASCASGITVVGIDNGFGAACAVLRLTQTITVRTACDSAFIDEATKVVAE